MQFTTTVDKTPTKMQLTTTVDKTGGSFHETEQYRPKPTETAPKNANNVPNNYTIV